MSLDKLEKMADRISVPLIEEKGKIHVVSHFDADGICAGSIAYAALKDAGKDFDIEFVKQLEESELSRISSETDADLYLFTDLGSGQLDNIRSYLPSKKIVIADHHQPQGEERDDIYHMNCHLEGIDGKDEVSGAGVTYILMKRLSPKIKDFAYLTMVGAAGDVQKKEGIFKSVNKELLEEVRKHEVIEVKKGLRLFGRSTRPLFMSLMYAKELDLDLGQQAQYIRFISEMGIPVKRNDGGWITLSDLTPEQEKKLITGIILNSDIKSNDKKLVGNVYIIPGNYELREFATMLNSCGRMDRAEEGMKLCLGMIDDIKHIQKDYKRKIAKYLSMVKERPDLIRKTDKASYLIAKDEIEDNFVGTILSILSNSGNLSGSKVFFAFANSDTGVKVSARANRDLEGKVNLGDIISESVEVIGGEGGGHSLAAGAKIPLESEEIFIAEVERRLP